jgi:hypothetical protein
LSKFWKRKNIKKPRKIIGKSLENLRIQKILKESWKNIGKNPEKNFRKP